MVRFLLAHEGGLGVLIGVALAAGICPGKFISISPHTFYAGFIGIFAAGDNIVIPDLLYLNFNSSQDGMIKRGEDGGDEADG